MPITTATKTTEEEVADQNEEAAKSEAPNAAEGSAGAEDAASDTPAANDEEEGDDDEEEEGELELSATLVDIKESFTEWYEICPRTADQVLAYINENAEF